MNKIRALSCAAWLTSKKHFAPFLLYLSMKDSVQNWGGADTRLQSPLSLTVPALTVPPSALWGKPSGIF